MRSSRIPRLLALFAAAILLAAGACNRGGGEPEETFEPTEPPAETPSTRSVSDFQLVGLIDEAFAGLEPPIDVPEGELDRPDDTVPSPDASPAASPQASPIGATPTRGGIMRLQIEDLSDDLRQACDLQTDDVIHVYWTTNTFFEPPTVLEDIEDRIEDRTAGMLGRVFRAPGAPDRAEATPTPDTAATATPDGTPTGSPSAEIAGTDCILVAEQIGFTRTTLPTPRPAARATAAPGTSPTAPPTPTPTATTAPTTAPPTAAPTTAPPTAAPTTEPPTASP